MIFTDSDNSHEIKFSLETDGSINLVCTNPDREDEVIVDIPLKKWEAICAFLLSQKLALEDATPTP